MIMHILATLHILARPEAVCVRLYTNVTCPPPPLVYGPPPMDLERLEISKGPYSRGGGDLGPFEKSNRLSNHVECPSKAPAHRLKNSTQWFMVTTRMFGAVRCFCEGVRAGGGEGGWTLDFLRSPTDPRGGGGWTLDFSESPTDPLGGGGWTLDLKKERNQ